MEKKFIIIMIAIVLLLTVTLGVRLVYILDTDSNLNLNEPSELNIGENECQDYNFCDEDITAQDATVDIAQTITAHDTTGDTIAGDHVSQLDMEIIEFGGISWNVLDERDGKVLLLSEFVFEPRAYHREFVDITWADSDIRRWLNGEFYNRFSNAERRRIAETHVINNDNPWFGTPGGQDTTDKIFLLSLEELALYFCDSGELRPQGRGPAGWAINDQFGDSLEAVGLFGDGLTASWWLRSPGSLEGLAAHVSFFGVVYVTGYMVDCYEFMGIRPAMWIYR